MTGKKAVDPKSSHLLAFRSRANAEEAYTRLRQAGLPESAISFFVHAPASEDKQDAELDHAIDVGGTIGAIGGGSVLAGLALLTIPGAGPFLAAGPLSAALTGAIGGSAVGGFVGALVGAGVSETNAAVAAKHLAAGRAILMVADHAWTPKVEAIATHLTGIVRVRT